MISKKQWKENTYIFYRKIKAFLNKICFYLCGVLPIQKNLVSVCTFEGKGGFGCNPKYIVEELHRRNSDYEFVWFVNDMRKEFPDYIKKVPNTLWSRAYWLSISGIWIDNYRKPYGTRKRKGQCYINTWHGAIGFKTIGLWRGTAFSQMAYLVSKNDSDMIDYVTIDSKWCEEMFPKGLVYSGQFLKSGSPRCDVMYGDRKQKKISFKREWNLHEDVKVVMFAPTFREKNVDGKRVVFSDLWSIDFERMLYNFEKKFGGEWVLCTRLHPQIADKIEISDNIKIKNKIIDVSNESDVYEILAAMDALVTDYSCIAMDAGIANIPVFIYADDIDKYVDDRGSFLWDITTRASGIIKNNKAMTPNIDVDLPFTISENNDEFEKNILLFNQIKYEEEIEKYSQAVGLVFDNLASKRVVDKLEELRRSI